MRTMLAVSIAAALTMASGAPAATITKTVGEYSGGDYPNADVYPKPSVHVGDLTYVIPAGESIVSATLTGKWGNSVNQTTARNKVYADGIEVANTYLASPDPYSSFDVRWSYAYTDFSALADGTASLEVVQWSGRTIRLGPTTLSIETGAVPEPSTFILLGMGAVGLLACARRRRKRTLAALFAVAWIGSMASAASADIALTFTGGVSYPYVTTPLPNTVGWEFTLAAPVVVTDLGFYDIGGNGLVANHPVTIWDSGQNQVVSSVVTGSSSLAEGFRWTPVTPVALAAGVYRIGASVNSDDDYFSETASRTTAFPVTYDGGVYALGAFAYPTTIGYTNGGRFGPNFQFTPVVPEPSTLVLLGAGGAGLLAIAWRRRVFGACRDRGKPKSPLATALWLACAAAIPLAAPRPLAAHVIGVDAVHGSSSSAVLASGVDFSTLRATIAGLGDTLVPLTSFQAADLAGLDGLILVMPYSQNARPFTSAEMDAIRGFAQRAVFVSDSNLWSNGSDRPITFGDNRRLLENSVDFIASRGVLFVADDGTGFNVGNFNSLVAPYGIGFASSPTDGSGRTVTGLVPHAVTAGVSTIGVDYQLPITVAAPSLDLTAGSGQDNVLAVWTPVPEPSTVVLLLGGALGLLAATRRRRKRDIEPVLLIAAALLALPVAGAAASDENETRAQSGAVDSTSIEGVPVPLEFPITLNGATGPSTINFEEIPPANGNSRFLSNEYAALGIQFITTDDGSIWAGSSKGDPGSWDLEGTNGPAFLGFNGASYSLVAKFTSSITDFSLDVSRSAGSSAGNTFTLQGYLAGGLVDSQTITLGPIDSWSTITLTHDNLDEVRWFGSGSGYRPYGVDNVTWVSAVPEPSMLVLLGIGAVGPLAFLWLRRKPGARRSALGLAGLLFLGASAGELRAEILLYTGADAGVLQGQPYPNSDAAAAAFQAAVTPAGTITFESAPLGYFTGPMTLAPGVTVSLANMEPDSALAGIRNNGTYQGGILGFNTTPGGARFLGVCPRMAGPDVTATFSFAEPVSAFGAYLTSTETTVSGTLTLNFSDGTARSLAIPKNNTTGVQFFGFTDAGASITSVVLKEAGPFTSNRDIFGVDDVTYGAGAVPEPSTFVLFGIGAVGLAAFFFLRRKPTAGTRLLRAVSSRRNTSRAAEGASVRRSVVVGAGLALLSCVPTQARADLTQFASRAEFNAAFPGAPLEDFEEARIADGYTAVMPNPLDSSTNNVIFSSGDIVDGLRITAGYSPSGPDVVFVSSRGFATYASHAISFRYANCTAPQMTLDLYRQDTRAVAFDLTSNPNGNAVTVAVFSGSASLGQFVVPNVQGAGTFFGVVSDADSITHVTLTDGSYFGVDNVALVGAVPEPSTSALLAAGAFALLACARRRGALGLGAVGLLGVAWRRRKRATR